MAHSSGPGLRGIIKMEELIAVILFVVIIVYIIYDGFKNINKGDKGWED